MNKLFIDLLNSSLKSNNDSLAVSSFNKSLEAIIDDQYLQRVNYQKLAEISFDNNEYLSAGLYYDSTLTKLERKTKLYRKIKKKRDNLQDLIFYEDITRINDSILALVNMSMNEREKYFQQYISELKKKEDELKEEGETEQDFGSQNILTQQPISYKDAVFYFYNPTAVAYGKTEFSKKWGKRKLINNWRWSIEFDDVKSKKIQINS